MSIEYKSLEFLGYPHHKVGNDGTVWSRLQLGTRKLGPWRQMGYGHRKYPNVHIKYNYKGRTYLVHKLVLLAFVGPCPPGQQCRHLDGNPWNNNLSNLCWGTPQENGQDKISHGTSKRPIRIRLKISKSLQGEKHFNAHLTATDVMNIRTERAMGIPIRELAARFNVSIATISMIAHKRRWSHI